MMLDETRPPFQDHRQDVDFGAAANHPNGARELRRLHGDLLAARQDLADGVMPRAARITGTSPQLAQVIARIDAAIRTAESLLAANRCSDAAAHGSRTFDGAPRQSAAPTA
jgi:hypothetical protein